MRTRPPSRTLDRADRRGYFPLTVAIHTVTLTEDEFGERVRSLGAAVLSDLDCRIASPSASAATTGVDEIRREDGTIVVDARIITLKTYQPIITTSHVAKVSGDATEWDIIAVSHDGQQAFTRLTVEDVS